MEQNIALLMSGFFVMLSEQADSVEVRQAWFPSSEWLPAEMELYRILGI